MKTLFIRQKNYLFAVPKPLSVRVLPCTQIAWASHGVSVRLPEFANAPETHALVAFDSDSYPREIAKGDEAAMESLFQSFVSALETGARTFDVQAQMKAAH